MGLVSPIGSKIDLLGVPIFESVAWFFVIILKFIFTPIFKIIIPEKKTLILSSAENLEENSQRKR